MGYMGRLLVPNLLTLGNLALGSWAIALSYEREWMLFALALGGAMICDWLDGWLARLLNAASPLGKELDALADLVSFGIAPAFALYNYLRPILPLLPYDREWRFWMVIGPFGLPLLAAWRLARFNVTSAQTHRFFKGLPTPAHGALWGLWLLSRPEGIWLHPVAWIGWIFLIGLLMISHFPFLSLKSTKNLPWLALLLGGVSLMTLWISGTLLVSVGLVSYAGVSYAAYRWGNDAR